MSSICINYYAWNCGQNSTGAAYVRLPMLLRHPNNIILISQVDRSVVAAAMAAPILKLCGCLVDSIDSFLFK